MAYEERVQILSDAEQNDFYGPPVFTSNDQRFFFTLNDRELAVANKFRNRGQRCMFIVLLGYFKAKPVVLNPGFHQIKHDVKHVHQTVLSGPGFRPFNLSQKENERIYKRIFELCGYQRWSSKTHGSALVAHLTQQAKAWSAPRHLFDTAIEYLSGKKIAIPSYSTLQKIISQVVGQEQDRLITHVDLELSQELKHALTALINGDGVLTLKQLRQSARNFTGTELEKELTVHRHIQNWMSPVNAILSTLSLSQKNQQHLAERVDYYGAKIKRQSLGNQRLYLLCYLQFRWQQALERIADGFVHHVRQAKQKSKAYAQESVYQDWQKAAKNVSKAAEVLYLFIDDSIDQQQPFGVVRQKALKLLAEKDLESVYMFLNEQKRSVEEAMWQYYDQRDSLREGLLRQLFLCLRFEGSEGTQRLATAMDHARLDLSAQRIISKANIDGRLPPKKQLPFLQDEGGTLNPNRYEWYLYLQIPDRLNGQLTLPDVIKYRALDADLVCRERWRREKHNFLEQTQLLKLTAEPNKLIERMVTDLDIRLHEVSDYLEQGDNRNIILRNPKGKRLWRLPTGNKKHLVNNPFFQQIPTTGVADVLRMVDRDTGFIDCFEHGVLEP